MSTASRLTWQAAGEPQHPYSESEYYGVCATCGAEIDGTGVAVTEVEAPTTSGHADLFRFGGSHVCHACAWLFAAGKGRPGNYIAWPGHLEYTVISLDSVVQDKRPWLHVLRDCAQLPAHTPIAGVMTTDVKPRLWPRVRLATVESFGLYVHAPEYDVSEWVAFDLRACLSLIDEMMPMLAAGYAKASIFHSLFRDFKRSSAAPANALRWESMLAGIRGQPHFLPALIAAGVTKEQKHGRKDVSRQPDAATASGDQHPQAQLGLLQ